MKQPDSYKLPYYKRQSLRFECTGCGACCSGRADEHVFLAREEARRIGAYLGVSWRWFRRRYLARSADGDLVLQMKGRGNCVFLREDNGCSVYAVRPGQCRTYPFWPELVTSGKSWNREARRCEGIGKGARVPLSVIESALAASAAGEQPENG